MKAKQPVVSLRDRILAVPDFTVQAVEVPEWGVSVYVRTATGHQRVAIQKLREGAAKAGGSWGDCLAIVPGIVALLACDQDGEPLFTSSDVAALGEKSPEALDRVAVAGLALNGLADTSLEEAKKK